MPKLKAIRSCLYRSFGPALVRAVAFAFATTALADPVWDKVGEAFGKAGTEMPGGVYRIVLPRTDIKATLDGVELKPGFALGGWLAFQKMGDTAMVMGDLVLTRSCSPEALRSPRSTTICSATPRSRCTCTSTGAAIL